MNVSPEDKPQVLHLLKRMKENIVTEPLWPRVNAYICRTCGHVIFTVDCAPGVTPMFLPCEFAKCKGTAFSAHYSLKPVDYEGEAIDYEWVQPAVKTWYAMQKFSPSAAHHVGNGGLILHRGRTKVPVLCHDNSTYLTDICGVPLDIAETVAHVRSFAKLNEARTLWLAKRAKKERLRRIELTQSPHRKRR
jgi:hypothetical protein